MGEIVEEIILFIIGLLLTFGLATVTVLLVYFIIKDEFFKKKD